MNYVVRFKSMSEEVDSLTGSSFALPARMEWADSKGKNNTGHFLFATWEQIKQERRNLPGERETNGEGLVMLQI